MAFPVPIWIFVLGFIGYFRTIPLTKAQDVKTWRMDTNFLNPRNWEHSQLPCANDRVIFPGGFDIITLMPDSFAASELVLPNNGEIIFPENSVIELTGGTRENACIGKDVHFKITMDFWFEALNWNITSAAAFPQIPRRRNTAVPHAFQVPCPADKVEFPSGTTFRVHVNNPSTVAFMDINNVGYSQAEFNDLLRTRVGSLLFPNDPSIRITSSRCIDETGCACGNDNPQFLPTICVFVTYCPKLECSDPIQPIGSCCAVCGARLVLKRDRNFKLENLLKLHHRFLAQSNEFQEIESFTSKTYDGNIQSVFVDGPTNKGLANRAAQLIYDALKSDMTGARLYKVKSVEIQKSEKWEAGVPTFDQYASKGMSSGGVAALVIILLICLGLGAAFYVYRKRQIPGFNFARFDFRGDKIELELGTTPHDELQPEESPSSTNDETKSKGFNNPVYGTAVEEVPPAADSAAARDFIENPMFTIFEDSPDSSGEEKAKPLL